MTLVQTEPKKIYIRVDVQWWQPWANTIAYYPFDTDFNDVSWNNRNLTNTGGIITTLSWVTCAYYDGSSYSTYSWYSLTNTARTMSMRINALTLNDKVVLDIKKYNWNSYLWALAVYLWGSHIYAADLQWTELITTSTQSINTRYYVTITQELSTVKLYVNWNLEWTKTNWPLYNNSNIPDGWWVSGQFRTDHIGKYSGYLSKLILEDKVRTAQEVSDYYNQTKSLYWIN